MAHHLPLRQSPDNKSHQQGKVLHANHAVRKTLRLAAWRPAPIGAFVIGSIAKSVPIASTYRGVLPFLLTDVARLGLVVTFPGLAPWLLRLLS